MIQRIPPFGINIVVNAKTICDLDSAIGVAAELGASEFLLLPEEPNRRSRGIDRETLQALHEWIARYCGTVPLTISEAAAATLDP